VLLRHRRQPGHPNAAALTTAAANQFCLRWRNQHIKLLLTDTSTAIPETKVMACHCFLFQALHTSILTAIPFHRAMFLCPLATSTCSNVPQVISLT
jgi:hypothetical protein